MVSEAELINVCNILVNIKLLNGVCPQASCNNCAQPTYINPQSVVLTVPVRQLPQANRISVSNPAIITHASGPCCNQQNPQVQSVTWINQGGSWNANNSPGSLPSSNYQNPLFPIQTPPNRTQSPLTQSTSRTTSFTSSPQGIYNYNNVNAGFSTTPSPITVTNSYNYQNDQYNSESPGNNYNNANGEYNTQSPPSESSYNNLNDGYNQQPQSNNNNNNYNNVNGNYNTQQPPFMTNDYNNANAAYNTQQPQATNNNQYNAANDGYNAESQNTGFPYQSSTFSPAYNAPNDAFNANAGFDASYNNANANYDSNQFGPTSQAPNAQTGDYINTFEGTFVEPANSEANSQSYNANQGFGASTPSPIAPLYPSQQINQVQTAQDSYQGQGSQQQPNDQSPTNNYQYQASTAPNDNFNQGVTSTPFAYSTVNPNANFNPSAQYPVTATADFNQQPTNFDYSTTYNPNSGYNSNTGFTQSPQNYQGSTIGSQGINVSPLNDPQYQTTPNYFNNNNNNNNDDGASAAGVGMAGSMPIGSSTYAPTSTTVQQTFPTSTVTPFGQDASGQFVQPSASSTGQTTQGFYSLTSPTPMNTNGQQGAQTTGFTQQPSSVATNSGLPSAQHTDMNYQYSQGVGGDGSTQQMGTSLPFTGNTQRTSTAQTQSPFDSTLNADAQNAGQASRLYDHGDMNTIYGNYNSTTAGSTAGPTEAALQRDEPLTQSFAATSTFTAFAIALLSTLLF